MSAVVRSDATVVLVRVADLKVDHSYQRPLDARRAARIGANYNPDLAGVIDVSERDDGLYNVDGQHRAAGAEMAGIEWMLARIHGGLSQPDEARLFALKNTTTVKPRTIDVFRARVQAGDATAVKVASICTTAGITVSGSNTAPRATKAIGSVERIYRLAGADGLAETLRVLLQAFPGDASALDATPIVAVGSFIAVYRTHPNYSETRLIQKLGEKPAKWIMQRRQTAVGGIAHVTMNSAIDGTGIAVVLDAYNRGLRTQHLPSVGQSEFMKVASGQPIWTPA